ncbi:MAG TPA: copper chaperone PCu(A)C [Mycobacteriales bacterium]
MSRSLTTRPRTPRAHITVLGGVAVGAIVAGCGSSTVHVAASPSFSTGSGEAGAIQVTGAYIPQPANNAVAAAYFTVTDDGAADVLTGATSDVSTDVGLHETVDSGSTGTMVSVPSIAIPAHGSAKLAAGGYHVMLMHPSTLTVGQQVRMTLHFQHAAPLTLLVPVVPLTDSDSMGNMTMGSSS